MGATLTQRYGTLDGKAYPAALVGWAYEQDPYDYHYTYYTYNSRFTIVTDDAGGASLTVGSIGWKEQRNNRNHILINQDPNAYLSGSTASGTEIPKGASSVTLSVNLLPNTTYYLWFVNNGAWSDRSDLSSATVSVSGSYGTAGTPSASDGQFGKAIPIRISGQASGAKFTVKASCAGNTETLLTSSAATSLSWTPAVATYAPLVTDAASAAATITVETYYGSAKLYTESTSITVSWAAGTIPPTLSSGWASAAPLNEGAAAGFTVWIQKYSKARVSFTPSKVTTQYAATIRSFTVTLDDTTVTAAENRADTDLIAATSASLLCTVTDSRGQTASETLSVTLYPYARPSLSGVRVFRCDAAGAANEDSTYVSAKATANISPLGGENSVSLRLWTRKRGESWGGSVALSSGVERILSGIDPDSSYEIWIQADDALGGQAAFTQILPTRVWAMKFRPDGSGVAFGKAAEHDKALELPADWTIRLGDAAFPDNGYNYLKLPGGVLLCWVYAELKNAAFSSAWGSLYYCGQELRFPDWPVAFAAEPYVFTSVQGGGEVFLGRTSYSSKTNPGRAYAYCPVSGTYNVSAVALGVGRWK